MSGLLKSTEVQVHWLAEGPQGPELTGVRRKAERKSVVVRKGLNRLGSARGPDGSYPGITSIAVLALNPEKPQGLPGFLILYLFIIYKENNEHL